MKLSELLGHAKELVPSGPHTVLFFRPSWIERGAGARSRYIKFSPESEVKGVDPILQAFIIDDCRKNFPSQLWLDNSDLNADDYQGVVFHDVTDTLPFWR